MEKRTIGGQAVIEGVMLRDAESGMIATANRLPDGKIKITRKQSEPAADKKKWKKIPIVRGVVSFVESMIVGTKTLMDSAETVGGEYAKAEEPTKFEKYLSEKLHVKLETVVTVFAMLLGLGLALFLFSFLPTIITGLLAEWFEGALFDNRIFKSLIEGLIKLVIFISYLLLVSMMKDIKRTFSYHGAEHKTINCYESGEEVTVENVRASSRVHPRCGTSFLFFVLAVSIVIYSIVLPFGDGVGGIALRVLYKILLMPLIAGISFEIIRFSGKSKSKVVRALISPGLWMQKITTREPDDSMIEVGIAAFHAVLDPDFQIEYPQEEEQQCASEEGQEPSNEEQHDSTAVDPEGN